MDPEADTSPNQSVHCRESSDSAHFAVVSNSSALPPSNLFAQHLQLSLLTPVSTVYAGSSSNESTPTNSSAPAELRDFPRTGNGHPTVTSLVCDPQGYSLDAQKPDEMHVETAEPGVDASEGVFQSRQNFGADDLSSAAGEISRERSCSSLRVQGSDGGGGPTGQNLLEFYSDTESSTGNLSLTESIRSAGSRSGMSVTSISPHTIHTIHSPDQLTSTLSARLDPLNLSASFTRTQSAGIAQIPQLPLPQVHPLQLIAQIPLIAQLPQIPAPQTAPFTQGQTQSIDSLQTQTQTPSINQPYS